MPNPYDDVKPPSLAPSWSNRILIASTAGILFLTLFPFRLNLHASLPSGRSPFLLGSGEKSTGVLNMFLNMLLFAPFGFGLSEKLRERGSSRKATLILALLAAALFSYGIEFAQIYIPTRDSGWEDVLTNTTGCAIGFLFFEVLGGRVVRLLAQGETLVDSWLSPRKVVLVLSIYFALGFAISALLQKDTQLSNWDPGSSLLVGNEASGRISHAWKGQVSILQFWDRALEENLAQNLTSGNIPEGTEQGLLATYEFSGAPPFRDRRNFLPDLVWATKPSAQLDSKTFYLDGESWLTSQLPITGLTERLQKSKQFSVRVLCSAAEIGGADGRIVSISRASGLVDLNLRQEDADLVSWFRNPLSVKGSQLAWYVPSVFAPGQVRDILYSYDGSSLTLYIDGKRVSRPYQLGPGTSLARLFRRVKTSELEAYDDVYYSAVFLPAGLLLGIAARRLKSLVSRDSLWLIVCFLAPPLLLEWILVEVSGRFVSIGYTILSFLLIVAGSLWINADREHLFSHSQKA